MIQFSMSQGLDINLHIQIENLLIPELQRRLIASGHTNVQSICEVVNDETHVVFVNDRGMWLMEFAIKVNNGQPYYIPVFRTA